MLDVVGELAAEGMTMMVATHEMHFAQCVAHRVVLMEGSQILEDARTQTFFAEPATDRAKLFVSKILHH